MSLPDLFDYEGLQNDFQALVDANNVDLGFAKVFQDANMRDFLTTNMPILDIRQHDADPQATTNETYYNQIVIECEICCYSLVSRREAAKMRNQLVDKLQRLVKNNRRFSAGIESTTLGRVVFAVGETKDQGNFVAGATLAFNVFLYAE